MQPSAARRIGPYRVVRRIGAGAMGVVYEVAHTRSERLYALKQVDGVQPEHLDGLRREIHALQRLRHPYVVEILDCLLDTRAPWFVMELLPSRTLADWIPAPGQTPDLPRLLCLLRRVALALGYVHARGIVHADLKPNHVFLPSDERPVLADFGLSAHSPQAGMRDRIDGALGEGGTSPYLAPERLFGERPDARADFYSLGVIVHQLLTGRLPRGAGADCVRSGRVEPEPPSCHVPSVPPALDRLVLDLLEPDPRGRPGSAADLLAALEDLGVFARDDEPAAALPSGQIFRATQVGRSETVRRLITSALETLEGKGGRVFLRGESGIGKTHLAAEMARRLPESIDVQVGASRPVGDPPLAPLRGLLREFARTRGATPSPRSLGLARLLADYEPALAELVPGERPVRSTSEGEIGRRIDALREVAGELAARRPRVLILDDVHWADALTIRFLTGLADGWLGDRALLVVAILRNEGNAESLLASIDRSQDLDVELGPLDAAAIGQAASEMLAVRDVPGPLSELLARHTEGNPYRLGELLRAGLVSGVLGRGPDRSLRFANGIATACELPSSPVELAALRMQQLEPAARRVANLAAFLDHDFAAATLERASGLDRRSWLDALSDLIAHQIVEETPPSRYRLAHDRLSAALRERVAGDDAHALHLALARSLEQEDERELRLGDLAHHFGAAGIRDRERLYAEQAGLRFLRLAAFDEAPARLQRVLELADDEPALDARARARIERAIARCEHALGHAEAAEQHARRAVELGDAPLPSSALGWTARIARVGAGELLALATRRARAASPDGASEAAAAADLLTHRFFLVDDLPAMVGCALTSVRNARRTGHLEDAGRSLLVLAALFGLARMTRVARRYFESAQAAARSVGDPSELAFGLASEAVYQGTFGRWSLARSRIQAAEELLRHEVRDPFVHEIVVTTRGHVEFFAGDPETSIADYREVLESARRRGSDQTTAWGLFSIGRGLLACARNAEALPYLEEAQAILDRHPELQSEVICAGLLARCHLEMGDEAAASARVGRGLELIRRARPTGFPAIEGYAGLARACTALAPGGSDPRLDELLAGFRGLALLIPAARPGYWLARHEALGARERRGRALRAARRSLDLATRFGMPRSQSLARAALASLQPERLEAPTT